MAKKKKSNKGLFIALAIIAIIVIVAILVIYLANPGGLRDKILEKLNGGSSNSNTNNSGGSQNQSTLVHGEGELQFHMLDTKQGDWLLLIFPDGKEMLVDAGSRPDSTTIYNANKAYLDNYITDGQIDYVVLTHSDQDHVSYLDEIFADYQVSNVYMPALYATPSNATLQNQIAAIPAEKTAILDNSGIDSTKCYINSAGYARFYIAAMTEPNCNVYLNLEINSDNDDTTLDPNSKITSSDNTYSVTFFFENLEFYNSKVFENSNTTVASHMKNGVSPTMIVEYNGKRIVLTGDANGYNEPYMVQRMQAYYGGVIDCDVLKVAHHGSHEGSSADYLAEVTCEYAMLSCGVGNEYNHPRQVALDRIKDQYANTVLYRTDLHGTIVCKIDKDGNITITPTNTNVSDEALWKGADAA